MVRGEWVKMFWGYRIEYPVHNGKSIVFLE